MPSFTAKVVVKVASFKKGANKVIAKLSLKKSVNKKDVSRLWFSSNLSYGRFPVALADFPLFASHLYSQTLVERLNASKKAAAAVEVAEEAGDVAAVALTQQGQVKAALVDAILQTDQDTVYLRPSCSLGGSFDDDEDEDEDDAPATVWESASSGFTSTSSRFPSSVAFPPLLTSLSRFFIVQPTIILAPPISPPSPRYSSTTMRRTSLHPVRPTPPPPAPLLSVFCD